MSDLKMAGQEWEKFWGQFFDVLEIPENVRKEMLGSFNEVLMDRLALIFADNLPKEKVAAFTATLVDKNNTPQSIVDQGKGLFEGVDSAKITDKVATAVETTVEEFFAILLKNSSKDKVAEAEKFFQT